MNKQIETYKTLKNLVDMDDVDHKDKDIASLFLVAMNDWPTCDLSSIEQFLKELKNYFGNPLTIEKVRSKKLSFTIENDSWKHESGSSITELISISAKFCNQVNFDLIIESFMNYYNEVFKKVDFVARLKYHKSTEGGRLTQVFSGYRPQVKFEFTEMQSSGQQTFIDKETVFPGDEVTAKIKILSPEYFEYALFKGIEFEFREGSRVIGTGEIEYIVNERLEMPADNFRYDCITTHSI